MPRTTALSTWKIFYGIAYGAIVAGAYLFAKIRGSDGGLALFSATTTVAFALHLLIWPRSTLLGFLDRKMCLRGFLYGVTQVLIFKAQAHGHVSTALVASAMGSVFGVLLGRIYLKEKVQGLAFVAVACCFFAVFLNPALILNAHLGVLGGFIQGTGFVLARSLMLDKKGIRQSISTGLGMAALVTLTAQLVAGDLFPRVLTVLPQDLLFTTFILFVIQYGFFYLYKNLDSQRASILTLSRIPWVLALEAVILGTTIRHQQLVAAGLITTAAFLLLVDARLLQRRAQQQMILEPQQ